MRANHQASWRPRWEAWNRQRGHARSVRALLGQGRLDEALLEIPRFIDRLQADPRTAGQPIGCRTAERLCLAAGRRLLGDVRSLPRRRRRPLDVYLASILYPAGGHTAVIGDFVTAARGRPARLLLTDFVNEVPQPDPAALRRTRIAPEQTSVAPQGPPADKLRWLLETLQDWNPQRIFLFHHPHDMLAVAAAQLQRAERIYLVHHVDFMPCLGVDCPRFLHIDVTPFRYAVCGRRLAPRRPLFVPLCVDPLDWPLRPRPRQGQQPLRTATSGDLSKFALTGPHSYPRVIARLIAATGVIHLHIGPLSGAFRQAIQQALAGCGRYATHFRHVPHVPSLSRAMREHGVGLYLNSFPHRGARASVEVMCSGTPAIWLAEDATWFHDTHMKYAEAAVWRDPEELIGLVQRATPEWLADQAAAAREWYERHHHPSILARCLEGVRVRGWQPPAAA